MTQLEAYNLICAALQRGTYQPHAPFDLLINPSLKQGQNANEETTQCTNRTPSETD